MSLAVCQSRVPPVPIGLEGLRVRCGDVAFLAAAAVLDVSSSPDEWLALQEEAVRKEAADKKDGQFDIWTSIQSSTKNAAVADPQAPYVHPLVRRSASSLSQKSLEICTESLGSETGSDGFSSDDLEDHFWSSKAVAADEEEEVGKSEIEEYVQEEEEEEEEEEAERSERVTLLPQQRRNELAAVNYHCSIGKKSTPRSFPPPLPSISRRDGPCLSMRPHRRNGRLVVEAVPVPSQNYLHAKRQDGRLLLTFIDTTFQDIYPQREEPPIIEHPRHQQEEGAESDCREEVEGLVETGAVVDDGEMGAEEEEGEEEVEVVDRGIVIEVKVSRQQQPQSGGMKVQRSSVVINKFLGGNPSSNQNPWAAEKMAEGEAGTSPAATPRRLLVTNAETGTATTTTITTATAVVAAAAAASSSLSTDERYWRNNGKRPQSAQRQPSPEKLFFTSKRMMNRQDLMHQVRRCSQHHRPLFIWEPCCIATSS